MLPVDLIFPGVAALAFSLGLFIFLRPKKVIQLQIKFYSHINWKMEPVSWGKELRNTRFMGLMLVFLVILAFFYVGLRG